MLFYKEIKVNNIWHTLYIISFSLKPNFCCTVKNKRCGEERGVKEHDRLFEDSGLKSVEAVPDQVPSN